MQLSCAFDNLFIYRVCTQTLCFCYQITLQRYCFLLIYANISTLFLMKILHFLYNLLIFNGANFTLFLCKILHTRYHTQDLPLCV